MAHVTQPLARLDEASHDDGLSSRRTPVSDAMLASADDSGQGLALFALFTVAVLLVTAAVAFLALLTSWWVLGVVFGIHVLVTVIVGTAVFSVLGNRKPSLDGDNVLQLGVPASPGEPVQLLARSGQSSPIAA